MSDGIVLPRDPRFKDYTGQRLGKLTVLSYAGRMYGSKNAWLCRCDCGREFKATRIKDIRACVSCAKKTHGKSKTVEHDAWLQMRDRCLNPHCKAYRHYGGRGIMVCERWNSFENFLADMGPRPDGMSLERKDNNAGYCPENCVWATQSDQTRNQRRRTKYTFRGESRLLSQWAEELGIPRGVLSNRLYEGWSIERAFTTPHSLPKAVKRRVKVAAKKQPRLW